MKTNRNSTGLATMTTTAAVVGAALILLASAFPGKVQAGPPGPGGSRGGPPGQGGPHGQPPMGGFIERHAERLGLDDATVASIRKVVDRTRSDNEKIQRQIETEHKQMRIMLDADSPNEKRVMQQADTIGALYTKERKNRLRAMLKIRALLTPEQRAELQKIRREMHEKYGDRPPHGSWHGKHGGPAGRPPGRPAGADGGDDSDDSDSNATD